MSCGFVWCHIFHNIRLSSQSRQVEWLATFFFLVAFVGSEARFNAEKSHGLAAAYLQHFLCHFRAFGSYCNATGTSDLNLL